MSVTVIGADISQNENVKVDAFIPLHGGDIDAVSKDLEDGIYELFDDKPEFDAIICANGGFAMDDDDDGESDDGDDDSDNDSDGSSKMMEMNYYPVVAACSETILPFMTEDEGLFIAFGSAAALNPPATDSPMKKYIHSKREVHDLIQELGIMTGKSLTMSRRRDVIQLQRRLKCLHELTALAILPHTLDTPMNRNAMNPSEEDLQEWTNLEDVANEIGTWMRLKYMRPTSGSLIKCVTKNGASEFILSR